MSSDPIEVLRRMVEKLAAHVRPTCGELWEEAQAALASLSAPKRESEWVELAQELQALIDGAKGRAFTVAERAGLMIRVAALNDAARMAPKPESAEAVRPRCAAAEVSGAACPRCGNLKPFSAPPRPEASAPVGVDLDKVAAHLAEHGGDYDALIRLVQEATLAQQPAAVDGARRVIHELCDCPNGRAEHAGDCAALAGQQQGGTPE